jgi:hypothetical protein
MTELARRTVKELVARYELEPSLDDVFVEGPFDKEVLSNAFRVTNVSRIVYEIATVDVPTSLLEMHGLTCGNRQRVIALARELAAICGTRSYACLADKDLDHWFGSLETTERLYWSKYCAIELHFFLPSFVENMMITCKAVVENFQTFFDAFKEILVKLYVMRLADRHLSLSLRWLEMKSCVKATKSQLTFLEDLYIDKVLQASGKSRSKSTFISELTRVRATLSGDCRDHIHGHDFFDLLATVIRQLGSKNAATDHILQRLCILTVGQQADIASEIIGLVHS